MMIALFIFAPFKCLPFTAQNGQKTDLGLTKMKTQNDDLYQIKKKLTKVTLCVLVCFCSVLKKWLTLIHYQGASGAHFFTIKG